MKKREREEIVHILLWMQTTTLLSMVLVIQQITGVNWLVNDSLNKIKFTELIIIVEWVSKCNVFGHMFAIANVNTDWLVNYAKNKLFFLHQTEWAWAMYCLWTWSSEKFYWQICIAWTRTRPPLLCFLFYFWYSFHMNIDECRRNNNFFIIISQQ